MTQKIPQKNNSINDYNRSEAISHFEESTSFIGSDIADPTSSFAERPPRTAKHVVTISWSWSPMHSRLSEYRLAADKDRKTWNLYEITWDDNTGKKVGSRVATGTPYKGIVADRAAHLLLKSAWQSEVELWEFDPAGFEINEPGLLGEKEICAIAEDIEWITCSTWLKEQTAQSIDVLRPQLPEAPDDEFIETLDEISFCADELGLTQDFLDLCKHYELAHPHLLSLACLLIKDATVLREGKEQNSQKNLGKFRAIIDLLITDLDSHKTRGGGITVPSVKERTQAFLERYVGEHGSLPVGEHLIHSFFKTTIDFDKLRQKYSL